MRATPSCAFIGSAGLLKLDHLLETPKKAADWGIA
jgi:hypothetical protein